MPRFLVLIASISLAFLAISSTCLASPAELGSASAQSSILASTGDGAAFHWPSSVASSRIVGGGLLSL